MKKQNVSDVRRRSWETRRKKYGKRGHGGSYAKPQRKCEDCDRMRALLVKLHNEGVLSEGQTVKATGLERVEVRKLADEQEHA